MSDVLVINNSNDNNNNDNKNNNSNQNSDVSVVIPLHVILALVALLLLLRSTLRRTRACCDNQAEAARSQSQSAALSPSELGHSGIPKSHVDRLKCGFERLNFQGAFLITHIVPCRATPPVAPCEMKYYTRVSAKSANHSQPKGLSTAHPPRV